MCGKLAMPAVIAPTSNLTSTLTSAAMANANALQSTSGSVRPRSPAKSSPPAPVSSSSSNSAANGDDLGSSDEVKVFNNEDDDDEREVSESGHLQNDLQEEKSSLITESETDKSRFPGAGVPGFGFNPYSLFPNYYGRSPFLYGGSGAAGDMAAAAAAAAAAGLRHPSSLYGLSHPAMAAAAAGYPYPPMLGTDQLAAWHHQQAFFRPGSPYNLPITSNSLSPMARFSPTGFLSHQNLAAAVAAGAGSPVGSLGLPHGHGGPHSLPHPHLKQEFLGPHGHPHGGQMRRNGEREASPSKNSRKDSHIKKPLNAFMLYMKEMRPVVQAECTLKESAAINQILGRRWHNLTREEQAKYYEKARAERQKHMQMYPHWNARDNYRFGVKKKKKRRDKADDPSSSMKKCRARYGLDRQSEWCKPCRRKKKCIRVGMAKSPNQGESDGPANAAAAGNPIDPNMPSGLHNGFGHYPPLNGAVGPASSSGSGSNGNYGHSDGEDDDASTAGERSPSGTAAGHLAGNGPSNGPASVSPSEQSLTSPAGFGSLPSIGSPGGSSIASPSTPSSSHLAHLTSASAAAFENNPMASFLASEWFNRSQGGPAGQGAFKPPIYAFGGQKPQIGTDPKDSNHPLSVNQLTNGSSPGSPSMMGKVLIGSPSPVEKKPLLGV